MRRPSCAMTFAIAAVGVSVLASDVITVPLQYRRTSRDEDEAIDVTGLSSVKLRVGAVVDKRDKPGQIGVNVEDDGSTSVETKSDVAEFVRGVIKKELGALGIAFSEGGGSQTLDADIVNFWVEEGQVYKGEARLRLTLRSASGKELWAGLTSGTSTRWGRSRSRDNYNEVLSDSLAQALGNLMREAAFRQALRQK